jgi:diaminopimelate decarboxylase
MCLANKMGAPRDTVATVAGRICESGDMLIWDAPMPAAEAGDVLAVSCTGAFNYAMASNYNRVARPAVVLVRDGRAEIGAGFISSNSMDPIGAVLSPLHLYALSVE